jgi:lipopolysaccharide biosynthesis glycosyltransferase
MNLKYIRDNNLQQQFLEKTAELKNIITCPDQDVFNIIFENKYKVLPMKYNIVVDITSQILDIKQYIHQFSNSCFVIHYTGGQGLRPWLGGDILAEYFWSVAQETPFYQMLKENSKHNIIRPNPQKYEILYSYSIWNIPIFVIKRRVKDHILKYWLFGILVYKRRE